MHLLTLSQTGRFATTTGPVRRGAIPDPGQSGYPISRPNRDWEYPDIGPKLLDPGPVAPDTPVIFPPTRGGKGRARGCRRLGARARLRPGQSEGDRASGTVAENLRVAFRPPNPRPRPGTVPSRLRHLARRSGAYSRFRPDRRPRTPRFPGPRPRPGRRDLARKIAGIFPIPIGPGSGKLGSGFCPGRFPICRDFGKSGPGNPDFARESGFPPRLRRDQDRDSGLSVPCPTILSRLVMLRRRLRPTANLQTCSHWQQRAASAVSLTGRGSRRFK